MFRAGGALFSHGATCTESAGAWLFRLADAVGGDAAEPCGEAVGCGLFSGYFGGKAGDGLFDARRALDEDGCGSIRGQVRLGRLWLLERVMVRFR